MFLGCQSHIYQIEINSMWSRTINNNCYTFFFHIFTKSFALFPQIKFCSGRKLPLMGMIISSQKSWIVGSVPTVSNKMYNKAKTKYMFVSDLLSI